MQNLIHNDALIMPIVAWTTAQVIKMIGGIIKKRRIDLRFFIRSGGMPSAHTSLVCSLATAVGMIEGWDSVMFAISAVFASVVMYDAAGVRHSVGKQAAILNRIIREIREKRPRIVVEHDLKELIGHTPRQVFAGAILGIVIAIIWVTFV